MGTVPDAFPTDGGVLVIDDMFTTGNTLRASATILRRAGYLGKIIGATAGYDVPDVKKMPTTPFTPALFKV